MVLLLSWRKDLFRPAEALVDARDCGGAGADDGSS
jgi:hypothetical protein